MATCKTSELNEKQLNHLVAQLEDFDNGDWLPDYSTDWAQGGPIIEREKIKISPSFNGQAWVAHLPLLPDSKMSFTNGPTPLITAMRCYVTSKLGGEVEVPEELAE